jgi:hypothetical protein
MPRGVYRAALAAAFIAAAAACSGDILEVTDPDVIDPASVSNATGAGALRNGALARFSTATSGAESMFLFSGLLADEFRSSDTFSQRNETDRRSVQNSNANVNTALRDQHRARVSAMQAAEALIEFAPESKGELAEMYFVQAFIENQLGEHFCSGIPFSTPTTVGEPLTTEEVFQRALAHADSAIAAAGTDTLLSRSVKYAAAVVKGRILLNLEQYDEAAAAVTGVPTSFQYVNLHAQTTRDNAIWSLNNTIRRYTVANNDGGNGVDFIAAADPRLAIKPPTAPNLVGFDDDTPLYSQLLFPARNSSFAVVTGVEARLIEAEAAIKAGQGPAALGILNALRAGPTKLENTLAAPVLPALTQQVGEAAQITQLFRERAFWLYASGHRLGDLRRLVRQYGRDAESVFPTGEYPKGGDYGTDVNFPVTQAEENNPNFTGCINRDA